MFIYLIYQTKLKQDFIFNVYQIISGQYVCPNTNTGSPQVEVETIGIPIDCNRQRTKIVQRNSLNPIWNDTFRFRVYIHCININIQLSFFFH